MLPALAIISALTQFAPQLVKMIGAGSDIQGVADKAAKIAQVVTGTDDPETAIEELKANPDLVYKYQQSLLDQEKDFETLYISDKSSARLRDSEFLKAGSHNYRAEFLTAATIVGVFIILAIVIKASEFQLTEYSKGVITTILGVLLNQMTNIFNFEFGTTRQRVAEGKETFESVIKSANATNAPTTVNLNAAPK